VGPVLLVHRRGAGDPTYRIATDGAHWRGIRTPAGPATLRVAADPSAGEVHGRAWGSGAGWALDHLPRLLGADDDPAGFVPPAALREVPSREGLRLPVDGARSRAVQQVVRVAGALERAVPLGPVELDRRLRTLPGVGVWTSAEVRSRVLGDADAVSFGDYHVAADVGWALTGEAVDDDGLAELLEPYRPHRQRVQRLVEAGRLGRPRRGPRLAPRVHLPDACR
jgi:hypothetical protein